MTITHRWARLSLVFAAFMAIAPQAWAQAPLTLADAMARARAATPEAKALAAAGREATERVRQARAGYLPRVELTESVQRGNQPVFVFGSLLAQRRFTADNFAIDELNRPDAVTNVRTAVALEQSLFDGGATRLAVQGAELNRQITETRRVDATQALALAGASAFVRVLQLEAAVGANQAAVDAAESDLQRARARRDVGLVTDADVLAVEVHQADARERQVTAAADLSVARLLLNEAMGAPLDEMHTLVRPEPAALSVPADALVREALTARQDRQASTLQGELAATLRRSAEGAWLPRVGAQAGWEFNANTWLDQRASWVVGAQVQLNLFKGFADVSRIAEARFAETRAAAEREGLDRRIEVEVRTAMARLEAARARQTTGRAALAQARESQRIFRDRYDSGLATITDVLRASQATFDAESRASAAELDVILESVALDRAAGRL